MTTRNLKPYPIYTTVLTGANLPPNIGYRPRIPQTVFDILKTESTKESLDDATKHKIIQTIFRESEAQTDPYEVDVVEVKDKGLEILTLGWLSWNHGLPAGMNEIIAIERARQRRAWEAALPPPFDETTKYFRQTIIEAMEINEWNYREEMIAAVGSLRMELAKKAMKEKHIEKRMKYEKRLSKYIQAKREEKNNKILKLRTNTAREIRKLTLTRQKVNRKYHRWNIVKLFADKTSELYAPVMRFGTDPRNRHEKIPAAFESSSVFHHLGMLHLTTADIPAILKPAFDYNKNSKHKEYTKELCIRWTKWTESNLEKLHEELRHIRRRHIPKRPCHLKQKVVQRTMESEIPSVAGVPDEEEEKFQCCLFLQKTVKGRAIQAAMFEGRVKCQELIEELKSTHALQNNMEDVKAQLRRRVYGLQRQEEIEEIQERRKNEILCALEGKTTGDMLDFLSKELLRLQDERKTHAMALAANLERHKREAAEAGRRQVEEQRRREHDEMFKHILKMHQNTVQAFLEEVMLANREWVAHSTARGEITEIAKKVDQAALESVARPLLKCLDGLQEEEIIADLIHNFALPEAEKRLVRERMKKKQKNYLRVCHDEVYSNIEKVVTGPRNQDGDLLQIPMQGKHKVPPLIRVKYLHLKRMGSSSSSLETLSSEDSDVEQMFAKATQDVAKKAPQPPQSDQKNWSSGFSIEQVILKNGKNDSEKRDE